MQRVQPAARCCDVEKRSDSSPPTDDSLLDAVLEQVMRCVVDDASVLPFLGAEPASRAAQAALGRLVGEQEVRLKVGSPLLGLVTGTPVEDRWRDSCPSADGSLWVQLEFLRSLYGDAPDAQNPYEALEALRARADSDLT